MGRTRLRRLPNGNSSESLPRIVTPVTLGYGVHMCTYQLEQYAAWMRSWGAAESTIAKRVVMAEVIADLFPNPQTVSADELGGFLANPAFSPWTRSTYFNHIRSLFGWLTETGRIPEDPSQRLRRPRSPGAKPRPLTAQEATNALRAAEGDRRTWLLLGMFAGLRAHETAKLRGEDVTERALYVRGKGGKDSMLPTHPLIWQVAQSYPSNGYWFPSRKADRDHVCSQTVSTYITRLFRQLGIEGSYHRCRHLYGTNLLRSGVNLRIVQDLMRHSSLATTANYLGVNEDERRAAIERLAA
jgi:integrase/recombinase XerD